MINVPEEKLTVYPNPTSTFIRLKSSEIEHTLDVTLFNLNGQIVMTKQITQENNLIHVASLDQGVYILKAQENNRVYQQKLIVK